MIKKHLLGSILLLSFFVSFSQDPVNKTYSLKDAVDYALLNNIEIKNSKIQLASTRQKAWEVITIGLPQIEGSAKYTNFFTLPTQLIPGEFFGAPGRSIPVQFGRPHNFEFGAQASQLLMDARYFIGLKARKDLVLLSEKLVVKQETDTKKKVIQAYYQALVASESEKIIKSNIENLEKLITESKEIYKEGFIEELDVDRLELALANLKTAINDVQNKSQNAKKNLKFVMGVPQDEEFVLTENLSQLLAGLNDIEGVNFDPTKRIEYDLLKTQSVLNGYDVKQKQAGYYPGLYAFFSYSVNAQRNKFDFWNDDVWFRQGLWGITLSMNIFDGLNKYTQVQQAKLTQLETLNNMDLFKRGAMLEVSVQQSNYITAQQQYNDQLKNLQLAQKIRTKSITMFKEGVGSSLAVAQSDADVVNAQLSFIQAAYSLLESKVNLDAALGKL